jgi:hypothetical protein
MPNTYKLYSLDVGQGMCTYFECYGNSKDIRFNLLFDLGSTKSSKKAGPPTINFLAEQIIKRKEPDGYIDAVFLSHKDADHINLLGDLLKKVPKARIGLVRYGGRTNWYKNRDKNILTDLGERTGDPDYRCKGFSIGHSYWNEMAKGFEIPIWQGIGCNAFLLAANTPYKSETIGKPETSISLRPDGDQANSKSLVIALFLGDTLAVIGGDATFPTFQYITGFFDYKFNNNVMMLLPHHGSRKTTFGLSSTNAKISDDAQRLVETYARRMNGLTVVASADTKHAHPSLYTVETFVKFADKTKTWWSDDNLGGAHYETAYIDIDFATDKKVPKEYTTFQSLQNIYSTLYYFNARKVAFSYAPFKSPPATAAPTNVAFSEGMNFIYSSTAGSAATELVGSPSNRLKDTMRRMLRADFEAGEPVPLAPPAPPSPKVSVSIRRSARQDARKAVSPPRRSSSFSRLRTVP